MSNPNKFLLVTSEDMQENNIAVLQCSDNEVDSTKLEAALSEHFDYDVQVNSIEELCFYPLMFIAKCSMTTDDGIDMFNVELNETWLY